MGYKIADIMDQIGQEFGPSSPILIDQERVQRFADATGDHQWIHVDVERAKAETPFGNTIAHGHLVLSLVASKMEELQVFPEDASSVMNYGFGKVRFIGPVVTGTSVTISGKMTNVEDKGEGRYILHLACTVQPEGAEKPVVIADSMGMVFS